MADGIQPSARHGIVRAFGKHEPCAVGRPHGLVCRGRAGGPLARLPDPWDFLLACALVGFWPLWSALIWSNINSLVFLLLAVAYRWPRHAGSTIGAAAAIKASPVLLLAVLIGRRNWRQVGIALATAAALTLTAVTLTGPRTLLEFVRVQLHETHPALDYGWSASEFLPETVVVLLALGLAGVAVVRRGSWAWALSGTLVLIPTLWLHYWIWALVPILGWVRSQCGVAEASRPGNHPSARSSGVPALVRASTETGNAARADGGSATRSTPVVSRSPTLTTIADPAPEEWRPSPPPSGRR